MTERAIEAALAARFGLAWRSGWETELPVAMREVAARRGIVDDDTARRVVLGDDALVREVAERLTVGESHFFRCPEQLEVVAAHLAALASSSRGPFTVWSAGCSRGEEPYTLAMMLEGRLGPADLAAIRIVGTDLHAGAIAQAREGRFLPWSFRGTSAAARAHRFDEVPGGFRIAARFRQRVELVHAPIQQHVGTFADGSLDVVLFRNVGIYLTPDALDRFFGALATKLRPGGLLVLSATDPQPALEGLVREADHDGAVHRRVDTSARARTPVRSARRDAVASGGSVFEARELADAGRFDEALARLDRMAPRDTDTSEAWSVRGQIHLAQRRYEEASVAFDRARTLAPGDPTLRFFAAISLRKLGRAARALSLLSSLEEELQRADDERGLLEGVRSELARLR